MIAPAPYNRDTLAAIRTAARNGMTIEQYAPRLGWSTGQLRNICQRNCIEMAAGATGMSAYRPSSDAVYLHGLSIDFGARRLGRGDASVALSRDALMIVEVLARAEGQAVTRSRIIEATLGSQQSDSAQHNFERAGAELLDRLPALHCALRAGVNGALALVIGEQR
jgi:DNA-binding response OmpR family regulator